MITRKNKIDPEDYKVCLKYIEDYWKTITFYHPKDRFIHIGLPYKYISPNDTIFKKDQFYWDSYFHILGLVEAKRLGLAKGIIDNFIYLFRRFKIIPMRNRYYNLGISQIPFFSSMIMEIYPCIKNNTWLRKGVKIAEQELKNYWMNENLTEKHLIYKGLSRYCDHHITHMAAEHESGWDMTSRFNEHCLDYLPVDLNSCLYKYETDLSKIYHILNEKSKQQYYLKEAEKRKKRIKELLWNKEKGFFFDYNFKLEKQNDFFSLAGFYPLWAKIATKSQAIRVKDTLKIFEYEGGLANTQNYALANDFKQHDYPNGWPQQQWIVIKGLLNYGFKEEALRLAKKWLDFNKKIFMKTGKFWERYNVVTCGVGSSISDRYPTQSGFGWTNSIFLRLVKEFS